MRSRWFTAVVAMVALTAAACSSGSSNKSSTTTTKPAAAQATGGAFTLNDLPALVQRVSTVVVTVITDTGEGSGVIWSSDGIVATNDHVISGAKTITVAFADGRRVAARLRATDAYSDVAVLETGRTGVPAARWATGLPRVGTFVVAVGNPLGLANSASAGIVSGLNRNISAGQTGGAPLVDLIQTDAAISPGNSGGGLADDSGTFVGMTEAYLPPSTGAVSIGLAIPAPTVVDTVRQLLATGRVNHAYLGVAVAPLTPDLAQQFNVQATSGAIVTTVAPNGPAANAGIQTGDVITKIGDATIDNDGDVLAALRAHKPGDVVPVTYQRNGQSTTVNVTLGTRT